MEIEGAVSPSRSRWVWMVSAPLSVPISKSSFLSSMMRSSMAGGVANLLEWGRFDRLSKADGPSVR